MFCGAPRYNAVTIMLQPARLAVDYSCCSLYSDADKLLAVDALENLHAAIYQWWLGTRLHVDMASPSQPGPCPKQHPTCGDCLNMIHIPPSRW